ncbi:PREDICTED: regenerating islet-derived protein 3-gamma-like [Chinchilla lanigera]|uniref:Regenerating islet-derived protein 3-gamma-like n=1 Tax=Chinchilla lanigera TaxID=34839 RepID=A0A8C2V546_CHILA|nr:PREDICTED: regenerating islet-derived protein 3-gamma-like [Chinchilla lanigera]
MLSLHASSPTILTSRLIVCLTTDIVLPSMALNIVSWMLLSCLMLLCQVQGEDSQKELPSPRISCPKGSKVYGSYCYALFWTPKSWNDDLTCQNRPSGHLASVLSEAEASFLSSLVRSSGSSYPYIWIGLHDPTLGLEPNAGGWEWSSTDVLDYFNWDRNPSSASDRGYCGSVSQTSGFLKWRDYNCDAQLPYICKFKA